MKSTCSSLENSFSLDLKHGLSATFAGLGLITDDSGLTVTLETPSHPSSPGETRCVPVALEQMTATETESGLCFSVNSLTCEETSWAIRVWIEITRQQSGVALTVGVENHESGWFVSTIHTPTLKISGLQSTHGALLWPNGLGQRYTSFDKFGCKEIPYPSGMGTMQWCALEGKDGGLYFGIHDKTHMAKWIQAKAEDADTLALSLQYCPSCQSGETWTSPAWQVTPFCGTWHKAAKIYRAWADTWLDLSKHPRWATQSTGWFLAILKQQNQEVLWSYRELEKVWTIAKERGLDTVGLFGWAHGGHDYLYPEYIPDPTMGGRAELKKAFARAHELGLRVVVYANGQLMDTGTEYFRFVGNDAMLRQKNAEIAGCSIRKFNSSTPVMFALGCPGSEAWRKKMMSLAEQAHDLGADGILYDQMGVALPQFCYATDHLHDNPAQSFAENRAEMMKEIADAMRAKNAEFAVMTEGVIDMLLSDVPYYHGWGVGFNPSNHMKMFDVDAVFPELFRYTFPEIAMTQRHATPMMNRHIANRTCVLGLRHEIEARYRPDVEYLDNGKLPTDNAFDDCTYYPPDVEMMQATPHDEATAYLRDMIAFRTEHADLLFTGTFLDTEGFSIDNPALTAKAYAANGRIGIVVWNPQDTPQAVTLTPQTGKVTQAFAPQQGEVAPTHPLPPQSIRLYVIG